MAASSGVFEEDIGGPPGMTNNTMAPEPTAPGAEADDADEADEADEEDGGGGIGGMFGGGGDKTKKAKKPKDKTSKKPGKGAKPAKGAPKPRGKKGRYTEEFSTSGIIPLIEESDVPLITFAIIAILISLN